MGSRASFAPGEFYHIYNRGTDKRLLFLSERDYRRFTLLLYLCNDTTHVHLSNYQGPTSMDLFLTASQKPLIDMAAYCLMPNHFHLLIRSREPTDVSRFMQKLQTAYTMYFNTLNERTGVLFQGKFKSKHADTDRYLRYLVAYIHLNPAKLIDPHWKENSRRNTRVIETFLDSYRYSSFLDYAGEERIESTVLTKESLPYHFSSEEFKSTIFSWLSTDLFSEVGP